MFNLSVTVTGSFLFVKVGLLEVTYLTLRHLFFFRVYILSWGFCLQLVIYSVILKGQLRHLTRISLQIIRTYMPIQCRA